MLMVSGREISDKFHFFAVHFLWVTKLAMVLEKWFPLQGERVQSLKVFNVRMLVFKNNIEMRKKEVIR